MLPLRSAIPANSTVKAVLFSLILIWGIQEKSSAQKSDTAIVSFLRKKALNFSGSHLDSMKLFTDSAFNLAKKIGDDSGIGGAYADKGNYNWLKGNYAAAIRYYDSANLIYTKLNRTDKLVAIYTSMGISYSRLGDYAKATELMLKALPLAEQFQQKTSEGKIYNSLGIIYKNQKNYDKAFDSYKKSLSVFKQLKSYSDIAGSYTNIGIIQKNKKQYDSSLYYHSKALHLFDSLQNYRGIVTCYNNLSDTYSELKNFKAALAYSEKSLEISRNKGFFSNEISALSGLGLIHTQLGDHSKAEQYYLNAITLARRKNYRTELVNLFEGLSTVYRKQKKPEKALEYFEKYSNLKDSILSEESFVKINLLQTSYELAKKEASIELLKKDNEITKLNRNRTIFVGLALLLMAGLIVALQRSKINKNKLLMAQQQIQQALSDEQLKLAKLKEQELLWEIEYKNKSLTTYALSMVQKNEMLEEVKESVELLLKKPDNPAEHYKKLSRIIDFGFTLDKDWEDFRLYFEEVHTDFFSKLRERFPDLGAADLKLCALIKLNLNMKQAASILRISPDSVKVSRYRLRKKFSLNGEDNLTAFIMAL